jgi:hypothetical protein
VEIDAHAANLLAATANRRLFPGRRVRRKIRIGKISHSREEYAPPRVPAAGGRSWIEIKGGLQ